MTNPRNKIAEVLSENPLRTYDQQAEAIIAALPGMVPDLVWDNETRHGRRVNACGDYILIENYPNGHAHYYIQYRGLPLRNTGNFPTLETAKAAANAHNRTLVMAGLGVVV